MFGMSKPTKAAKPVAVQSVKPAKAGARTPKPADAEGLVAMKIELSSDQHEKLQRLGGAEWVRRQIDKARVG